MKQIITNWWFFLQPNGLLGCYDEVGREIRAWNMTLEAAISESVRIADGDFEFDDFDLDHEAAVQAAMDQLPVPNATEVERPLTRFQIALQRDRERYGEERIEEYVDGLMAGSTGEIERDRTAIDALVAALSRHFGFTEHERSNVTAKSQKDERLNEQFREGSHLESVAEALQVLADIQDGALDAQVNPSNWVYDVGRVRMQIERDSSGRINSVALGPKVGDQLVRAGWAIFDTHRTEMGYRIKYYSITEAGRKAQQRLFAGEVLDQLLAASGE